MKCSEDLSWLSSITIVLLSHTYPVAGRRALTYEEECYIYLSDSAIKERHFGISR